MSKTKITFELDEDVLANARAYTARGGSNLNMLVNAFLSQLNQHSRLPAINPQNRILLDLSLGRISLMSATAQLGVHDAGITLRMLNEHGLPMPSLSAAEIRRQAVRAKDALSKALISPPRAAAKKPRAANRNR